MMEWWREIRAELPALEQRTYLNHAAMSPLPDSVKAALTSFLDRYSIEDLNSELHLGFGDPLRNDLAALLGCAASDIAFCSSTSSGLSRGLRSLPFQEGDVVLVPSTEFPAAPFVLAELEARGVQRKIVEPGSSDRPWVDEDDLLRAAEESSARACLTSWVSYNSGYRLDWRRLHAGLRERGCWLVLDAMQGVGAMGLDYSVEPTPEVTAFGPVKWVPGPSGIAACRLSPAARELMEHPAGGWCGVVRNGLLDLDDLSLPPLPDARALEAGSHGFLAQVGWKAAVELLGKGTVVQREQRILGLGRRLIDGLSSLPGVELASCDDDAHRSGITCLRHADGAALHQGLAERNIAVSLRLGLLRVAPHCWSTEEEIDLVLSTLAELLE